MDIHLCYPTIKLSPQELLAFERAGLVVLDLLTLDLQEVARKTNLQVRDKTILISGSGSRDYR